ncbi:hypothetical protein BS50DRAFT_682005 [Corynespora cassiicola Philippines]|uniref:MARVEL domain-containing protein n=1 Tax=Corynespora cassiicola Philippines TaxID=1448308 RepID=A0A2T2N4G1_CORCC|nr:hypothetical protein BS50DRAFT_682005 [Corynespora cassiicola Philippines]
MSFFQRVVQFDPKFRMPMHIILFILIKAAMIVAVVRIFTMSGRMSRSDTMALAMGAKSMVFLIYEVVTERFEKFKRWGSLKAYAIINGLEVVFWSAVAFLGIQTIMQRGCHGTSTCYMGWVVIGLAIFISQCEAYAFGISFKDFRYFKKNGKKRGEEPLTENYYEEGVSMNQYAQIAPVATPPSVKMDHERSPSDHSRREQRKEYPKHEHRHSRHSSRSRDYNTQSHGQQMYMPPSRYHGRQ